MKDIARISDQERSYVLEVLDKGFATSAGSAMNTRLEEAFSELYGSKYAITFVNGTTTMHTVLLAAGIGPGDEVIVPPLTMASTTFAVLHVGATPVYADVDPQTYQIDPASIKDKITNKTKAIITVALFGLSPEMSEIMDLAQKHDLFVLEDNAETMLSSYKGKLAGTIGHAASFSFQSSKHLTAGEGGIVITDDEELALAVRRISSLGYAGISSGRGKITKNDIQSPDYFRHVSDGFNFRMPELCAAVVLGQLARVDELVTRRIEVAKLFSDIVDGVDWLEAQFTPSHCVNSYWTFVVKLSHKQITWHEFRDKYQEFGGDGIYAPWKLTYQEPFYENIAHKELAPFCPVAEELQRTLLCFKTNYWCWNEAKTQAKILSRTLEFFETF
jgi:perosamine synthetase